jgi:hypothetical protein
MTRHVRFFVAFWLAAATLAACDGERVDPVDTTRSWFEAVAGLDLARVRALTCSRDNQAIEAALTSSGGLSREVDLSGLQAQIQIDIGGLNFEEKSAGGDAATVRVWGSLNGQPVEQDITLVNESDVWKVCTSRRLGQ